MTPAAPSPAHAPAADLAGGDRRGPATPPADPRADRAEPACGPRKWPLLRQADLTNAQRAEKVTIPTQVLGRSAGLGEAGARDGGMDGDGGA